MGRMLEAGACVITADVLGSLVALFTRAVLVAQRGGFNGFEQCIVGNSRAACHSTSRDGCALQEPATSGIDKTGFLLVSHVLVLTGKTPTGVRKSVEKPASALHAEQLLLELEEAFAEESDRAVEMSRIGVLHVIEELTHPRSQVIIEKGLLHSQ